MKLSFFVGLDQEQHQPRFVTYDTVKNFSCVNETSVLGDQVFVDVFECDVVTDDKLHAGNKVILYDDVDNVICDYICTRADKKDEHSYHIKAQSWILKLESKIMPAKMYSQVPFSSVFNEIIEGTYIGLTYDSTSRLADVVINGFCPEQTARERLAWLSLVAGGFVGDGMRSNPEFGLTNQIVTLIPFEKTFWHPTISYKDYVTAVKVTAYSFTAGEPVAGEEYVTDGITIWIVHKTVTIITNPNVPQDISENIISVDGCMLVNNANSYDIASRLATYHFKRMDVNLDVINNFGQIKTGDKVHAYISENEIITGYVERCDSKFGVQMRSSLRVGGIETTPAGQITINYMSVDPLTGNLRIATRRYWFPIGYETTIQNPYLSLTLYRGGYITYWFRPETETLSVVATGGMQTYTVNCYVALLLNSETQTLVVISVDEVDFVEDTEDGAVIKIAEVK